MHRNVVIIFSSNFSSGLSSCNNEQPGVRPTPRTEKHTSTSTRRLVYFVEKRHRTVLSDGIDAALLSDARQEWVSRTGSLRLPLLGDIIRGSSRIYTLRTRIERLPWPPPPPRRVCSTWRTVSGLRSERICARTAGNILCGTCIRRFRWASVLSGLSLFLVRTFSEWGDCQIF